jgi:hypothetical protein
MSLTCEQLNPLLSDRWEELVQQMPGRSFFHSANWARVLHDSYGYEPAYIALFRQGVSVALIPFMTVNSLLTSRRGVSLPFTDYCEPLITDHDAIPEVLEWLVEHARRTGWKTVEIRGGGSHFASVPRSRFFYRHTLDLSAGEEALDSRLRESTRRNIRKGMREGVEISAGTSLQAVEAFYRLNCSTRKQHGLPPQPYHFFKNIHAHILSREQGVVLLATYRNRTIAGAVCFHSGRQALYKYGASDVNCQQLRANNLVMWEALRWYVARGYARFCFGRTEPENQGLRQFKAGWGPEEQVINYYKYDVGKGAFVEDISHVKSWQMAICRIMPAPILRLTGAILYKSAG